VRQPHGDELRLTPGRPHAFAGELTQPPADGGVHATTDAEHQPLGAGVLEVPGQELDATFGLSGRVEGVGVDDLERGDDLRLQLRVPHPSQSSGVTGIRPTGASAAAASHPTTRRTVEGPVQLPYGERSVACR